MSRGGVQFDRRSPEAKTTDASGIFECGKAFSERKTSTGNP